MKNLSHLFLLILFAVFAVASAFGQTQDRRMVFDKLCAEPAAKSEDEDNNCLIELIDVHIGGQKITSGKPFVADHNWLKNLKIKIKNVSGKPFVAVEINFGLIEGLYEKLTPRDAWGWAFSISRGEFSTPLTKHEKDRKVFDKIVLKPNEKLKLTFDDLPQLFKNSGLMQDARNYGRIVFISARIQFKDGKLKDSRLFIRNKSKVTTQYND